MGYIKIESMSEKQFEAVMKRQSFWYGFDGALRKALVLIWVATTALMACELAGIAPAISANAAACGIIATIAMPFLGIADYLRFRKAW